MCIGCKLLISQALLSMRRKIVSLYAALQKNP